MRRAPPRAGAAAAAGAAPFPLVARAAAAGGAPLVPAAGGGAAAAAAAAPITIQVWDHFNGKKHSLDYVNTRIPSRAELRKMTRAQLLCIAQQTGALSTEDLIAANRPGSIAPSTTEVRDAVNACRTQVYNNRGLQNYLRGELASKRFFLCKKQHQGKCSRGEDCPNAHVDRECIKQLRELYPEDPLRRLMVRVKDGSEDFDVEYYQLAQKGGRSDGDPPTVRVTLVSQDVPLTQQALSGLRTQPSANGTVVFVNAGHMRNLRERRRACCGDPACPDSAGEERPPCDWVVVGGADASTAFSAKRVWSTTGFEKLCRQPQEQAGLVRVPQQRVCQAHMRQGCKYKRGCDNVHLCRHCPQVCPTLARQAPKQAAQQAAQRRSGPLPAGAAAFAPAGAAAFAPAGAAAFAPAGPSPAAVPILPPPGSEAARAAAAAAEAAARRKTKLCRNWARDGTCAFGEGCAFAHGDAALHARGAHTAAPWQQQPDAGGYGAPDPQRRVAHIPAPHFTQHNGTAAQMGYNGGMQQAGGGGGWWELQVRRREGQPLGLQYSGLTIYNAVAGSAAWDAGLRPGMRMLAFDGVPLDSDSQLIGLVSGVAGDGCFTLRVVAQGDSSQRWEPAPPPPPPLPPPVPSPARGAGGGNWGWQPGGAPGGAAQPGGAPPWQQGMQHQHQGYSHDPPPHHQHHHHPPPQHHHHHHHHQQPRGHNSQHGAQQQGGYPVGSREGIDYVDYSLREAGGGRARRPAPWQQPAHNAVRSPPQPPRRPATLSSPSAPDAPLPLVQHRGPVYGVEGDAVRYFELNLLSPWRSDRGGEQEMQCIGTFAAYVSEIIAMKENNTMGAHRQWCEKFNSIWGPAVNGGRGVAKFLKPEVLGSYLERTLRITFR